MQPAKAKKESNPQPAIDLGELLGSRQTNSELMQQAKKRKDAYLNLAIELGLVFESHQEKTLVIKTMIERLDLAARFQSSHV